MRYATVCSGIEAPSVAWHRLGWQPVFFSEIDAFPNALLMNHYPLVPNHGDMRNFRSWPDADFDVLAGGTPCQSFSVAGLREGLADPRGNLALTYLAVLERYRPRWFLWENVPGVLSSEGGADFAAFLGGVGELGYGWAYRVLDAQYFGVPQRRRRVFVVGSLTGWAAAAAVLFESACLRGNPPPSREARQGAAGAVRASAARRGGVQAVAGHGLIPELAGTLAAQHHTRAEDAWGHRLITEGLPDISCALTARDDKGPNSNLTQGGPLVPIAFDTTQITHPENRSRPDDRSPQLSASAHPPAIAFNIYQTGGQGADLEASETEVATSLTAVDMERSTDRGTRILGTGVRRLTPIECERLQGLPDNYTLVPFRGLPAKDGPRYRALGNSMAADVIEWLGRRIELVERLVQGAGCMACGGLGYIDEPSNPCDCTVKPKPLLSIQFRPLLNSGMVGRSDAGPVVLIDSEQPEDQQVRALWHEMIHLALDGLGAEHDENWIETMAGRFAEACPDILKRPRS